MNEKLKKFLTKVKDVHGGLYDYSLVETTNHRKKIPIICKKHGVFHQYHYAHLRGQHCPECYKEGMRDTTESFIEKAKKVHGDTYDYSNVVYKAQKTKVKIVCEEHGEFEQSPTDHLSGKGCIKCGQRRCKESQLDTCENFLKETHEKFSGKYSYPFLDTEYKGGSSVITIECPEHGCFTQSAVVHKSSTYGCAKCAHNEGGLTRQLGPEDIITRSTEVHNGYYSYEKVDLSDYKNSEHRITVTCPKHGDFETSVKCHIRGCGFCPRCSNTGSSGERELVEYIEEVYQGEIRLHDRQILEGKEIDIVLPELNLAFEYNGIYWHREEKIGRKAHQDKTMRCRELGIKLIHINEYDWLNNRYKIQNFVKSLICTNLDRVYARKTSVKQLQFDVTQKFCEKYHRQGYTPASLRLGLYDNHDRLIAVATFGKPRFDKTSKWELLRFCSLPDLRVVGGLGKIIKYFCRTHMKKGEKLITYASLDYGYGDSYKSVGFQEVRTTPPNYSWARGNAKVMLSRYQCQKHKLKGLLGEAFDASKSEFENMTDAGYFRIFDAGNVLYEMKV